jgi:hypothetical protein
MELIQLKRRAARAPTIGNIVAHSTAIPLYQHIVMLSPKRVKPLGHLPALLKLRRSKVMRQTRNWILEAIFIDKLTLTSPH